MTIIPNFLITGILAVIISMLILMWSVLFIQRSYGFPVWVFGQVPLGYLFTDLLQSIMGFGLLLILVTLPLSVYTAYARDVQTAWRDQSDEMLVLG